MELTDIIEGENTFREIFYFFRGALLVISEERRKVEGLVEPKSKSKLDWKSKKLIGPANVIDSTLGRNNRANIIHLRS